MTEKPGGYEVIWFDRRSDLHLHDLESDNELSFIHRAAVQSVSV